MVATRAAGDHRLALHGELDAIGARDLNGLVQRALGDGAQGVLVDLRNLSFIDSAGVSCLLELRGACAQSGARLELVPARRTVQRVFEVTGVAEHLPWSEPPP